MSTVATGAAATRQPVVVGAFSRGLDVFRPLAALYAAWLAWRRHADMERPWVAAVVIGVLMAWSLALLVYRRRTGPVVVGEVVIAVLAIFATLWADTPAAVAAGQYTLPTIWAAGSVTGAAVVFGARGGLIAAAVVALADLVEIGRPTETTVHNIILLFLLGGLIGLAVDLARTSVRRYEQMLIEQERLRERERLARAVHDGVLQTLAYIHRRGSDLGGPAAELGVMAAEQERSLRRLVSGAQGTERPDLVAGSTGRSARDVRALLAAREAERVSVSLPADAVLLDAHAAAELDAAVGAALDNVTQHAGPQARAWVLLEEGPEEVEVTVRDNGVGADLDSLMSAHERGRLGVSSSILGRAHDLGGSATVTTRPGAGCRVRISVPRPSDKEPIS